jgi:hypothetical protein
MMKRMILSGLFAFAAVPALASDASYDVRAFLTQTSTASTPSQKADGGAKAQSPVQRDCSCQHHHHS